MQNVVVEQNEQPSPDQLGLNSDSFLTHNLQAITVLASALLQRIESLRSRRNEKAMNLAAEVERFESALISSALVETGGRQRRAAKLLGMNITTLNRKLKRYKIKSTQQVNDLDRLESEVEHLS